MTTAQQQQQVLEHPDQVVGGRPSQRVPGRPALLDVEWRDQVDVGGGDAVALDDDVEAVEGHVLAERDRSRRGRRVPSPASRWNRLLASRCRRSATGFSTVGISQSASWARRRQPARGCASRVGWSSFTDRSFTGVRAVPGANFDAPVASWIPAEIAKITTLPLHQTCSLRLRRPLPVGLGPAGGLQGPRPPPRRRRRAGHGGRRLLGRPPAGRPPVGAPLVGQRRHRRLDPGPRTVANPPPAAASSASRR